MPDRPAPTIRTSTCSTSVSSGCRRGELVVERALGAEQLLAPLLHEVVGVAVVGVEVGPLVVAQLVPQLALHDRRAADPAPAPAEVAGLVGGPVAEQRDHDLG